MSQAPPVDRETPLPAAGWYRDVAISGIRFLDALLTLPVRGDHKHPANLHAFPLRDRVFEVVSATYHTAVCLDDRYAEPHDWGSDDAFAPEPHEREAVDWLRNAHAAWVSEERSPGLPRVLEDVPHLFKLREAPSLLASCLRAFGDMRPTITREEADAYPPLRARLAALVARLQALGCGPRIVEGRGPATFSDAMLRWLDRHEPEERIGRAMILAGLGIDELLTTAYLEVQGRRTGGPVPIDADAMAAFYAPPPPVDPADLPDVSEHLAFIVGSRRALNKALGVSPGYRDHLERLRDRGEIELRRDPGGSFGIRFRRDLIRHFEVAERMGQPAHGVEAPSEPRRRGI